MISIWLRPWDIPQSSHASPWKTLSFPPLFLRLTQSFATSNCCTAPNNILWASLGCPVAAGPQERDYSALAAWRKRESIDNFKKNGLAYTFPFLKTYQAEKSISRGPATTGHPRLMPIESCSVRYNQTSLTLCLYQE